MLSLEDTLSWALQKGKNIAWVDSPLSITSTRFWLLIRWKPWRDKSKTKIWQDNKEKMLLETLGNRKGTSGFVLFFFQTQRIMQVALFIASGWADHFKCKRENWSWSGVGRLVWLVIMTSTFIVSFTVTANACGKYLFVWRPWVANGHSQIKLFFKSG